MDNQNKPDPIKPVELEPVDMHGPLVVTAALHVVLPDGRPATISFQMEPGQIPTRSKIRAALDAMMTPASMEESSIPAGTRLMTKPEFVAHITKKETGQAIPMPGDQHFVPVPPDVPHSMLVRAIIGTGEPIDMDRELYGEYTARGLVLASDSWDILALDALPDDVLLAIYQRITA